MDQFLTFLMKNPFHLVLFGTAVVSGGMLVWPLINRSGRGNREVNPVEAVQLINRRDAVVVDVRDTSEFESGHITGSRHIPLAQVADRTRELEKFKTRPIILSCRSGARATGAATALRKQGFGEVFILRGGIGAWREAGMPLEKK